MAKSKLDMTSVAVGLVIAVGGLLVYDYYFNFGTGLFHSDVRWN